jgi:predicted HicB family RNase H-like nuclease
VVFRTRFRPILLFRGRVMETVEIDISDEDLRVLFMLAHKADVSLNQYIRCVLQNTVLDAVLHGYE